MVASLAGEIHAQTGNCEPAEGEAYLDVNNVRARILNNGNLFWRAGGPHVYEVPKGGGVQAVYTAGIWIGGFMGDELRLAAARYGNYQFWAGPLDEQGMPPADCAQYDRLYKVGRSDLAEYEATGVATPDLSDWPTGLGAPTLAPPDNGMDDDGDGEVDEEGEEVPFDIDVPLSLREHRVIDLAAGERPAIVGDQAIWWVMNDRGNEHYFRRGSSSPIGLEVHAMAFAFDAAGDMGNTTLYRYELYLDGSAPLDSTYLGIFADPDLGNFQDDWVGSDTMRGMGFSWNEDNFDEGRLGYGVPPAIGFDLLQGPMVPSPGDTAHGGGTHRVGYRNLKMGHFTTTENAPFDVYTRPLYVYRKLSGRWHDGSRMTLGGNGRDYSRVPVDFMFPGDPGYSDAECQFWSECNVDRLGTDTYRSLHAPYGHFNMSTGPFTLEPGKKQEVVFAIVWAQGKDNFDSVQELKKADDVVQAAFDAGLRRATFPAAPVVTATALDSEVILEWSNPTYSNNYLESYRASDPFARPGQDVYEFEGYTVYQYESAIDQVGTVIANYDVANGVTRVLDAGGSEVPEITALGSDLGVQHYHTVRGLANYTTYHFGVQAYVYNAHFSPRVIRSAVSRVEVIPRRLTRVISDAARAAAANAGADFHADKLTRGDGEVWARIVNPAAVEEGTYTVEFFTLDGGHPALRMDDLAREAPDPPLTLTPAKTPLAERLTFDIKRSGEVIFDGSASGEPVPLRPRIVVADGMEFSVSSPDPGFRDFLTVANAAGLLDPPESASFAGTGFPSSENLGSPVRGRQQSMSDARWGFSAGGGGGAYGPASDPGSFLGRALRGGQNLPSVGPYDYEMRFTERCASGINGAVEASDCLGVRAFRDGSRIELPFELWRTGIDTPDDAADDVRLIPVICDTDLCGGGRVDGVFDIGGDHAVSRAANDPYTDWVYWYLPEDMTPGEAGHDRYFAAEAGIGPEVMARTVLVLEGGGEQPPYEVSMPEQGTVFRIVSTKPIRAGDVFAFSTEGYGARDADAAVWNQRLSEIGMVPNPYIGASGYEVSPHADEVRFTNLRDAALVRIFTLSGTLVRTLRKQSASVLSWDLRTDYGLPVGSGVYLVHVEVPGAGTRVIKFGVVRKRTQLSVY